VVEGGTDPQTMNDLIVLEKIARWQKLKALVLDSVSSPITKRVYNMTLDEFMAWFRREPRPGFSKATVSAWRTSLEGRGLLFAFIFGRLYPDEDLIPSMMFSRSRGTPTGEGAVQQIEIGNRVHKCLAPARKRRTAHTGDLIAEKFDGTFMNPIIMRLNDSWLVPISKPN
jgi:hypothetical protein